MAARLDAILKRYTDPHTPGALHGASFIAVDGNGRTLYSHAAGTLAVTPSSSSSSSTGSPPPLQTDSLCWIASMSKLATSVAAMQCVERGLIGLDDDVTVERIVPALRGLQVLVGFEDVAGSSNNREQRTEAKVRKDARGKPIRKPVLQDVRDKGKITLRQLLSHSSGFCYDGAHPKLLKWSAYERRPLGSFSGSIDGYTHPLLFQPGSSWMYGPSVDWAGRVVEALTNQTLEDYMQANIWSPIDAHSTTFHPELHRNSLPAQLEMSFRPDGPTGRSPLKQGTIPYKNPAEHNLGGIGLYSTAEDYAKLLSALVSGGASLLKPDTLKEMFRPQLPDASRIAMNNQFRAVAATGGGNALGGVWPKDMDGDHSLCGSVNLRDVPGRRRAGSVNWGGMPCLHWWIDPKSGIGGCLFTQVLPTGDITVRELLIELETALYKMVSDGKRDPSQAKL